MSGSRKTELQKQPKDKWMLLPDATPPVIDKELFERVQARLERSRQLRPGRPKYDYLLTGHIICGACSSPLIGACLSRRYRYYRCRGAYETASRSAICNARYIKADFIETMVWDKVKDVLQHPDVLISELKRETEEKLKQSGDVPSLDKEITKLRKDLRNYEYQEKRLVKLFRYEEIAEDSLLDELNQLKQDRKTDEERLAQLQQSREQLTKIANAEIKLNEFCERVRQNLEKCTFQEKRLALDALDIKVVATQQGIDIKGSIPIKVATTDLNLLTTGQTWG
jgi:site-specific DNA recombinase